MSLSVCVLKQRALPFGVNTGFPDFQKDGPVFLTKIEFEIPHVDLNMIPIFSSHIPKVTAVSYTIPRIDVNMTLAIT